ncbi:MAG: Gfo/Idh/MocA family oxidoreductase [Verrucomicrobia bacterium]|jgi:predicted dehydrogenase|nr:Gfo/Idh/MocA family oxidoreductase [Verrucomicrobiota bacterium]
MRDTVHSASYSRRHFLRQTALGTAALASLSGPAIRATRAAANDQIRVGLIGSGSMGCGDLDCFLLNPGVECVVVCDVDDAHLKNALAVCQKRERKQPDTVKDFRRVLDRQDVDAVIIATPDHWHALPTVLACQAGKDVYVEKPLATTIDEGRAMVTAAQKHNRIVQMGSQWKSCQHIIDAAAFVKSGKLGPVSMVRAWAWLDWQPEMAALPDEAPPPGLDYDLWLGPAPKRPYNKNRCHYNFRWFWDYAGGLMTDWGVHLINMALMGMDSAPPRTVCATGGTFVQRDSRETPDSQIATYEFPDYLLQWEHKSGVGVGLNGRSWGVSWSGTEGTILLNDAGWELLIEKRKASLEPEQHKSSGDPRPAHIRNFLDCMKSRQQPVLNLEAGHHVSTVAHLGNIAFRSGHTLHWDAVNERIPNHPDADALVGVKYRSPWQLPYAKRA